MARPRGIEPLYLILAFYVQTVGKTDGRIKELAEIDKAMGAPKALRAPRALLMRKCCRFRPRTRRDGVGSGRLSSPAVREPGWRRLFLLYVSGHRQHHRALSTLISGNFADGGGACGSSH